MSNVKLKKNGTLITRLNSLLCYILCNKIYWYAEVAFHLVGRRETIAGGKTTCSPVLMPVYSNSEVVMYSGGRSI